MSINHKRRHFVRHACALASVGALTRFGLSPAFAATPQFNDYKALVCVFLYGGNDGNNMIIGADTAGYSEYNAVRSAQSGINIAQASLLQFQPKNQSRVFGFHPSMVRTHPLFAQGKLAVLANTGPLNYPMTKADYEAGRDTPFQLFSHADQQAQWQSSLSDELTRYGWGGRIADVIASANGAAQMPVITSLAGSHKFTQGITTNPLAVPSSGTFQLTGTTGTDSLSRARLQAINAMLGSASDNVFVNETATGFANAINLSNVVNPIISATNNTVEPLFNVTNNSIATQLRQAAKLIAARDTFGVKRQIFFVSLGGFDTHANQLDTQANLLAQLDDALRSFYDATAALGVENQVTTFTLSDFGRTFKAAAGGGSDHAWGNHHLIMGGAVKGGAMYGTFPSLALGGPNDLGEGRWLPTTSVDQYAATLATWFGVASSDLTNVLPNINAFGVKNLGFI
jgi:uncharacterized protein (DUF1501 family)